MQHYTVYLFLENCSMCFGWYLHQSSGAHITVAATCRYFGRNGTGLSVVRELYWSIQFPHHTQTSSNSSTIAVGSSNGLTSTRYCKYSCVCSWWWVEIPPEIYRTVFQKKIKCLMLHLVGNISKGKCILLLLNREIVKDVKRRGNLLRCVSRNSPHTYNSLPLFT